MKSRAICTICVFSTVVFAAACGGRDKAKVEAQTTTTQQKNEQTTASGCLTEAGGAFVLTTANNTESGRPATYALSAPASIRLENYVGQRVDVVGTTRTEQQVATTGSTVQEKPAKNADATPTVRTESQLDVRQMLVASVTPSGAKCGK